MYKIIAAITFGLAHYPVYEEGQATFTKPSTDRTSTVEQVSFLNSEIVQFVSWNVFSAGVPFGVCMISLKYGLLDQQRTARDCLVLSVATHAQNAWNFIVTENAEPASLALISNAHKYSSRKSLWDEKAPLHQNTVERFHRAGLASRSVISPLENEGQDHITEAVDLIVAETKEISSLLEEGNLRLAAKYLVGLIFRYLRSYDLQLNAASEEAFGTFRYWFNKEAITPENCPQFLGYVQTHFTSYQRLLNIKADQSYRDTFGSEFISVFNLWTGLESCKLEIL